MTLTDAPLIAQLTPAQRVGLTLYGEARGASSTLRAGIASAIANRVRARRPSWGLTADEVCLRPGQFSCWTPAGGRANYQVVIAAAQQLAAVAPITSASLKACLALGAEVVAGALSDSVAGATHYYAPAAMVPRDRVPAWAVGLTPVARLEGTLFFTGVQ